jgi:hypothetical protein
MQIDFHHSVTYAVARLAGFSHNESRIVSYAAQYVDDCRNYGVLAFDNGATFSRIASAHTTFDLANHCNVKEDCRVWVPFHFLPGNNGEAAGSALDKPMAKRLICTPDSPVATDMWTACTATKGTPSALHRLGITCHVYEDTFAHCDFMGILDNANRVSSILHSGDQFRELIENVTSRILELIPLGHGAVQTLPDWPFIDWSFRDSEGSLHSRGPERFLLATEQLFRRCLFYRGKHDRKLPDQDRTIFENTFRSYADSDGNTRHLRWMKLIREGGFTFGGLSQEQADSRVYADRGPGSWKYEALGPDSDRDDGTVRFHYTPEFDSSNWRLFHGALKDHQAEVLNTLLPKYGITLPLEAKAS